MDVHLEVRACSFSNLVNLSKFGICKIERVRGEHALAVATPPESTGLSGSRTQQIRTVKLCWMRLPCRQRHQERASRRHHDPKAVMSAQLQLYSWQRPCVVGTTATIRPPGLRRAAIPRERLCWSEHAGRSERKGNSHRKYRMDVIDALLIPFKRPLAGARQVGYDVYTNK